MNDNKIKQNLKIGVIKEKDKKDNSILITEKSRTLGTVVFGLNISDQRKELMYSIAKQQIQNGGNSTGCTFFVNGKEEAFFIASIAQRLKRKNQIKILKPSADINTYKAIVDNNEYNYDEMEQLIDYKQEIRDKSIIIIDVEEYKYKEKSRLLFRKLLQHLYIDIQKTDKTLNRPHYLYIENADEYIEDLEDILINGKDFNLSTLMFINSFFGLKNSDKNIIENNIKNYILLSNLSTLDISYFADKISCLTPNIENYSSLEQLNFNLKRSLAITDNKTINYCIAKDNGIYMCGKCLLYNSAYTDFTEEESIANIAKKIKKKYIVADNNLPFKIIIEDFNKKYYKSFKNNEQKNITKESVFPKKENVIKEEIDIKNKDLVDTIISNIDNIPQLYETEKEEFNLDNIIEDTTNQQEINTNNIIETAPHKKKKKKKKKKKSLDITNNVVEKATEVLTEIDNAAPEMNEAQEKMSETLIEETIEKNTKYTEDFNDYNNFEEEFEEPYLYEEEEKAIIQDREDGDNEMIISIKKPEEKIRTIDDEFEETFEGFAEKIIEDTEINDLVEENNKEELDELAGDIAEENCENDKDTSKTYFDIDSLFDDEDE